jgi:hypothetical protein
MRDKYYLRDKNSNVYYLQKQFHQHVTDSATKITKAFKMYDKMLKNKERLDSNKERLDSMWKAASAIPNKVRSPGIYAGTPSQVRPPGISTGISAGSPSQVRSQGSSSGRQSQVRPQGVYRVEIINNKRPAISLRKSTNKGSTSSSRMRGVTSRIGALSPFKYIAKRKQKNSTIKI